MLKVGLNIIPSCRGIKDYTSDGTYRPAKILEHASVARGEFLESGEIFEFFSKFFEIKVV